MKRVILFLGAFSLAAPAFQPDPAMLRRMFEESLSRRQKEFGVADPRTAEAARDLGGYLLTLKDTPGARRAFADAVRADEKAFGESAAQTLEDVASLASVSPPAEVQPLLRRAAESPDPIVAGPALTSLAALRKAAGDRSGAAGLLRRAVEKAEAGTGKNSPTVALILSELSLVAEPAESVSALTRALGIDRQAFGPQHRRTLQDARLLASLLRQTGRAAEAAQLEQQFRLGPDR
jgi:hypothetical protein